jgi:predicted nucleotidyltransferase
MGKRLKAILSELRSRFHELYGDRLVQMILYGSQARGDAEEGSDIDVLVVLKGPVNAGEEIDRSGGIIADISLKNDVVVSCVFMDEGRFLHRNGPLLRNIRREGVRI